MVKPLRSRLVEVCLVVLAGANSFTPARSAEPLAIAGYQTKNIEGWNVLVSDELLKKDKEATDQALDLLKVQLQEIVRVVPPEALAELRKVPLWISPEYPGFQPRAEYHPDAGWLRDHNRNPVMEKGVEFTNVCIFERETQRMPNFALHELAHAYHDRVLTKGFENVEIKSAYERARASGLYDRVEQRLGDGRSTYVRAYALTSPQEYFAECSEAFFATNDFFPFTRDQLKRHDREMFALLCSIWGESTRQ
jgi:Phosphoenolpyruvate:glucose-phosphotransferase regulator.